MKTIENAVAPIKMPKTIAVIFTVSMEDSINIEKENFLYKSASITAPTQPIADDSVGVAMPAKIEPRTITINDKGGIIENNAEMTWLFLLSPSCLSILTAGPIWGFK